MVVDGKRFVFVSLLLPLLADSSRRLLTLAWVSSKLSLAGANRKAHNQRWLCHSRGCSGADVSGFEDLFRVAVLCYGEHGLADLSCGEDLIRENQEQQR
jgi:hypothetical protein